MANPEHLAILKQGVEVWNRWRDDNPEAVPDLSDADLTGIDFGVAVYPDRDVGWDASLAEHELALSADPHGVNLKRAALKNANLIGINVWLGEFDEADLSGAELNASRFRRTSFRKTNLKNVGLLETMFSDCDLTDTDFTNSRMWGAIFIDVDLSIATGLEKVDHQGPSIIAIDALVKSNGNIPTSFLRGAGVPEPFIVNLEALIRSMEPIQFYSCFISYSTKDQDFADRLYADLQDRRVRCWFAPHDIHGGKKIHEQIDEAIGLYDRLLLILSEHSITSEWVKTEIGNARQREVKEKRQMLFPISLVPFEKVKEWRAFDADTGKDSAREIREYFIPDFSNWKDHDSYQQAFQRLLRDLRAEDIKHGQ
jgi:uncharacterized protein YjbI with pentapeptide repeats